MNKRHLYIVPAISVLLLFNFIVSCASKQPVLYNEDGSPLAITDYEKIAQKEFDERRYNNAIATYNAIISNYPDVKQSVAWAHYEIGFCYYVMEDYEQAEIYFRIVVNEYQDPAATKLADKMLGKMIEEAEEREQKKTWWQRKSKEE
jgi:TolA-binding protein